MPYGSRIELDNGFIKVSGYPTPEAALESAVKSARHAGWKPAQWWQFWKSPCPEYMREEYLRQTKNIQS